MSEAEAFGRILASLHEAALDPGSWSRASALIDEALGTHGNSLTLADGASEEDIRIYFAWTYFRGQRRRDLERLYFQTYYPLDEQAPRMRHAADSRLFHSTDVYTQEELKTSAAYNMLRTRAHAGNAINVRLDGPNGSRIIWFVHDPVDGDGWSSAQLDSIRRLLPHIRQTVRVQQTLADANAVGATLAELLEATGAGIIQLDGRGRIVAANDCAREVLRTGDGLCDEGGALFARTPKDDARLQSLLARALPPFGAQGAGGSTSVGRPGALPPLVLHVNPVSPETVSCKALPVAALVLVVDPAVRAAIDPALLEAALDLTRMEARVAVLLAQGMSVPEIAAATGRKTSTIRSHVKHMFAKHGLSRRAELVRLGCLWPVLPRRVDLSAKLDQPPGAGRNSRCAHAYNGFRDRPVRQLRPPTRAECQALGGSRDRAVPIYACAAPSAAAAAETLRS